ncbi:aldo/keto reductase [Draconibacterium sp.]|nr:aldo/keto reductase [Draconibacterium sp.]
MKKNNINRRKFLGTGLAAAATVTVGNSFAANETYKPIPVKKKDDNPFNAVTYSAMPTRAFGKTGYKVGVLSLGGQATLEIKGREEESEKIINRAIDLGINYIDTAASYGRGVSQLNIGRVMKTRRSEVWLSTKTHDRTYDGSMRLLEESLTNLQTDHLDTWQLHNVQRQDQVDQIFAADGAMKAMEKAKAEGMVRKIGITGHFEPMVLLEAIKRYPFDSILMAVNAADVHYLSFKNYLLPEAQKLGIAIIGMKVATRGRMISTWTPPPMDEQPERMATQKPGTITIKEALTYNMSLPVSTTIIGVDSIAQIEENVQIASDFSPLPLAEMEAIEYKTLPIVRQGLYFRRWDLGA